QSQADRRSQLFSDILLFLVCTGLVCFVVYMMVTSLYFLIMFGAIILHFCWEIVSKRRRLARLSEERQGLSICHFARSFERREVDPWVIRAVYEEVQNFCGDGFPILAEDDFTKTYRMHPDDLDLDIVTYVSQRSGRTLDACEKNPLFGHVHTVGDLVHFFNQQPLAKTA
ncbi:MAG: hypothetical protein AAF681_12595, partial [Pseudomonadota bacterium]